MLKKIFTLYSPLSIRECKVFVRKKYCNLLQEQIDSIITLSKLLGYEIKINEHLIFLRNLQSAIIISIHGKVTSHIFFIVDDNKVRGFYINFNINDVLDLNNISHLNYKKFLRDLDKLYSEL